MNTVRQLLSRRPPQLSVGINKADPLHLGSELKRLEGAGVALVHIDVMDGVFCPQLTVGPAHVRAVRGGFCKDVHLMIDEPLNHLGQYLDVGADILTIHAESTRHVHRALELIGETSILRGLALNPGTALHVAEPLLDQIDYLLLLMISPGWPAKPPALATIARRLSAARELVGDRQIALGVDGGVTWANLNAIAALGPDVIVSGSSIFDGNDVARNVQSMQEQIATAGATVPGKV